VAGWHFQRAFFDSLALLGDCDIFVVSHRPRQEVPDFVWAQVPAERVYVERNLGYDWGCYQQFLAGAPWREYDYIFFMHDDARVKDASLVDRCIALLDAGRAVVGNGRNSLKRDWPATHPWCYAHSGWKPPSRRFRHDTVRGSFVATKREVLERVGGFEIAWDRFRLNVRYGNWSLIATSGKIQSLFGPGSFAFLSEDMRESDLLVELERGGRGRKAAPSPPVAKAACSFLFESFCRTYMALHMAVRLSSVRRVLWMCALPVIALFQGGRRLRRDLRIHGPTPCTSDAVPREWENA